MARKNFRKQWWQKLSTHKLKSKAQEVAKYWRKRAYNARVIKEKKGYAVYTKYAGDVRSKQYGLLKKGTRKRKK